MSGTSLEEVSREDDVTFWSRQLGEHALFLALLLADKSLQNQGLELNKKWESFRNDYISRGKSALVNLPHIERALREYKMEVLNRLNSGEWLGSVFPLFADHVVREMNYFVSRYNGNRLSTQEEIKFWNEIMSDHAAFEAHLLDPTEDESIFMANSIDENFRSLPQTDLNQFLILSLKATKELDQFQETARIKSKKNQLKSIIHPVLVDHVIREAKRAIMTLNGLSRM